MCDPTGSAGRHLPRGTSRRDLLRYAAAGMGIVTLGPLGRAIPTASGAPGPQKRCVVLNLFGGNDGLNTVVPLGLQPYFDRRPTIAIPSAACLSLATGPDPTSAYGLHPALPNLAGLWAEGSVAVVNRVGYPDANLSHFTSQDIYSYAVRNGFGSLGIDQSGWVARYADLYAPTPMGAVAVGVGRPLDFVGGTSNPLLVDSLAAFQYAPDGLYPSNHLHRLASIQDVLDGFAGTGLSQEVRDALAQGHDLAAQIQGAVGTYTSSVTYPTTTPGRYLRDVAILVQGGFETTVFYTGFGGFDTHGVQGSVAGAQAALLARLDAALGAFAQDMKDMGVWDDMVVLVITEFGRRNYENASNGTDHGHGNCFLAVGGAVQGGTYGPDLVEADLLGEYPSYGVDFRDLYREVLQDHLGVAPAPVFPETQPTNTVLGFV